MQFYLILLLSLFSLSASSQQRLIETQQLVWLSYYQKAHLTPKWSVHTELDGRWFAGSGRQQQWLLPRVHVHYLTKAGADISLGAAYFLNAMPQTEEEVNFLRPEIRPHQELSLRQSLGPLRLEHRYRVEERFVRGLKGGELSKEWDFNWRFRYRLQLVVPLAKESKLEPQLKLYDEIMINAGKPVQNNFFDQNRCGASLSLKAAKNIATEFGYLHWFQQRPSGNAFFNRHYLRFSLIHSLYFYKTS